MGLALSNPQAAADLVLGYILDGTDEVNNLIGETVTGGRLNVYNALELALANCGPIECSTDSIYASSSCVYDPSLGEAVTEIQLGVELGLSCVRQRRFANPTTSTASARCVIP